MWVAIFFSRVEATDKASSPTQVSFGGGVFFSIIECGVFSFAFYFILEHS